MERRLTRQKKETKLTSFTDHKSHEVVENNHPFRVLSGVLVGFITWTGCLGSVTCDAADGSVEDAVMVECDLPRLNANDQLNGNPG
jgi:hypothetical protein